MITKEDFNIATAVIKAYIKQENKRIIIDKHVLTENEFRKLKSIKDNHYLTIGDVLILKSSRNESYEKVTCTGYCGSDEFWGNTDEGKERYWNDRDYFTIITEGVKTLVLEQ